MSPTGVVMRWSSSSSWRWRKKSHLLLLRPLPSFHKQPSPPSDRAASSFSPTGHDHLHHHQLHRHLHHQLHHQLHHPLHHQLHHHLHHLHRRRRLLLLGVSPQQPPPTAHRVLPFSPPPPCARSQHCWLWLRSLCLLVPVCAFIGDSEVEHWDAVLLHQFAAAYKLWQLKQQQRNHINHNSSSRRRSRAKGGVGDSAEDSKTGNQTVVDWEIIERKIRNLVSACRIVVFMKGSPDDPKCKFSAHTMRLLRSHDISNFTFVDVLEHPVMREGVKRYSQWPTVPQLFVDGRLLGGIDVLIDLEERLLLEEAFLGSADEEEQEEKEEDEE
eukprot:GHVS01028693.1.p1 GENE.GHVS01028693.1~~GHVS01028693.1.p1  ORF type:complete len:327 (+),score=119.91 GHVS01028693.1:403-1383(+)